MWDSENLFGGPHLRVVWSAKVCASTWEKTSDTSSSEWGETKRGCVAVGRAPANINWPVPISEPVSCTVRESCSHHTFRQEVIKSARGIQLRFSHPWPDWINWIRLWCMNWVNLVGRDEQRVQDFFADVLVPLRQGDCWWKMGQAGHVRVAMTSGMYGWVPKHYLKFWSNLLIIERAAATGRYLTLVCFGWFRLMCFSSACHPERLYLKRTFANTRRQTSAGMAVTVRLGRDRDACRCNMTN